MTASTTQGSCLCGSVQLQARLPAKWVAHCHCTYCRRAHGAAMVTWAGFHDVDVTVSDPNAHLRWYPSSPGARRASCSQCGSPVLFTSTRWPGETHIARALLDDHLTQPPTLHVFYDTHVSWLTVNDGLPRSPVDE